MESGRRQPPFFLLLLPLSFAAQNLAAQFGRASVWDAFWVALVAAGGTVLLALLLRVFLSKSTAALSAAVAALLALYWSYPYLRIKSFSGNSISLKGILGGAALFWMLCTWGFSRLSAGGRAKVFRFFNLLFGVLLLVNGGLYVARKAQSTSLVKGKTAARAAGKKPPVFLLLFDEAGSTASLRRQGIGDFGLDSFLARQGFFTVARSRSNYSTTHFSMASALNESYLTLPAGHRLTLHDYNNALCAIARATLVHSFAQSGYTIRNRSVFRLGDQAPFQNKTPLIEGTEVLTAGTLWARVVQPLWKKKRGQDSLNWFSGLGRNAALLKAIAQDAKAQDPVFCYAHFFLPHTPFYFSAGGARLSYSASLEASAQNRVAAYAANWRVAVGTIKQAVQRIRQAAPEALILLVGDHGYRNEKLRGNDSAQFQNLCAVYFPGGHYAGWSDTTTLVNAVRLLHNRALGTALPLLRNKTVSLPDDTELDW